MDIFFISPFGGKKTYQAQYDSIIQIIESTGVRVLSPEKSKEYHTVFSAENIRKFGSEAAVHYEFIRRGVIQADAVVVEASFEDFRIGHEMTLALIYDKPVLVLSKHIDYSRYITHEGFTGARYTDATLRGILDSFIASVAKRAKSLRNQSLGVGSGIGKTMEKSGPAVAVLGSINVDLVTKVPFIPSVNDVVISEGLHMVLGGKASNAAVGLSRLGHDVFMLGKTGNDAFGTNVRSILYDEQIRTEYIDTDTVVPTGSVIVTVDGNGKNTIIVNEDANIRTDSQKVQELFSAYDAGKLRIDCFYLTLEPMPDIVSLTVRECAKRHIPVFCDAAPIARPLSKSLYRYVDFLAPNEFEASAMCGFQVHDRESALKAALLLRSQGARTVIVTLGEKGSIVLKEGSKQPEYYPVIAVDVVDETAAGDAFRAAFVSKFLRTRDIRVSMEFATTVGAFAVTRLGSYNALPRLEELQFFAGNG